MSMGLNDLRDEALRIATEHGFTESSFVEDLALIHSEVSESLEDFRAGLNPSTHFYENPSDGAYETFDVYDRRSVSRKPVGIPSELADVIIRVAHLAGKHGIDLDRAVSEKMKYNEGRPYKHGKKL